MCPVSLFHFWSTTSHKLWISEYNGDFNVLFYLLKLSWKPIHWGVVTKIMQHHASWKSHFLLSSRLLFCVTSRCWTFRVNKCDSIFYSNGIIVVCMTFPGCQTVYRWSCEHYHERKVITNQSSALLHEIKRRFHLLLVRDQKSSHLLLPASILKHAQRSVLNYPRVRMWQNLHPFSPYKEALCELSVQQPVAATGMCSLS